LLFSLTVQRLIAMVVTALTAMAAATQLVLVALEQIAS
jgi:hypothetical protein